MNNKILKNLFLSTALIACLALSSCKDNKEAGTNGDTEVVTDSLTPVGSDGLGREVDTVNQISRQQQDSLIEEPAP